MVDYFFIESADPKVAMEIANLYREAEWWNNAPEQLEDVKNLVRGSHCFLIAMAKFSVIGMGRALSDGVSDAYVQDVTVLPAWRGRGIGSEILKRIVEHLQNDGIEWIGVVAERGTHKLYEELGFKEITDSKALLLKEKLDELPKARG